MTKTPDRRTTVRLLALLTFAVVGLVLFEIACQIYARTVLFPRFEALRANPQHYYRPSPNALLSYELLPNSIVHHSGMTLQVNDKGIRESSDEVDRDAHRVAVLGDSVVFGVGHDQDRTLSGRVEHHLDPQGGRVQAYNFGMGGMNMLEVAEFLKIKDEFYDLDDVVYLLNLNDYATRNSIYEGADNGLYRIYERPTLMSLWFIRKAIYRLNKQGAASVGWYQWMFEGNQEWGERALLQMRDYAAEHGIGFSVVLLPSVYAFNEDGSYATANIHEGITNFLESEGIVHLDPRDAFADDPKRYIDPTDHFHAEGADRMSGFLARALVLANPDLAKFAAPAKAGRH